MEKVDYQALGFICGIEIHQQLLTEKKLFCRCPAGKYSKEYSAEVLRHMRPTLSEMGVYDGTALMEFKTKKDIVYLLNKETVCTYDMDDTPPFWINQQAVDISIELAALLDCAIVDEFHIARKQYLDGSIPTGFQRTGIIGITGKIPFKGGFINIRQLGLEEDSCREVSNKGHTITFRTDRLGMPLAEVVTEAEMKTPQEAAEVVKQIGRLMRVTGKVRRGIGAVRQDVNVSIRGGRRVEIKGVARYQDIPLLTHNEALRQKALLEIAQELKKRGLTPATFVTEEKDLTNEFKNTCSDVLLAAINAGHRIRCIKLSGCAELLNQRTQPGKTFAHELRGRVKVIACLDGVPNLYHTDNYPEYKGAIKDWRRIKSVLNINDRDAGVIVWGPEADTITACDEIRNRILEAFEGVPNETRKPCFDGTTDFERILPGADRMYPDTDHPPIKFKDEYVAKIVENLPEKPWDREVRYNSWKLPKEIVDQLPISPMRPLMESMAAENCGDKIRDVAVVLFQVMKNLRRRGLPVAHISDDKLKELFKSYCGGGFYREAFPVILKALCEAPELPVKDVLSQLKLTAAKKEEVIVASKEVVSKGYPFTNGDDDKKFRYLMGEVMPRFIGRIAGKEASEAVRGVV